MSMYRWMKRAFEGRSVAEMSIAHTLFGIGSFIVTNLLCYSFVSDSLIFFLVALSLWFIFLIWLWIGLVKTVWKSNQDRLGLPVFHFLQIGVIVAVVFTAIPIYRDTAEFKVLFYLFLGFDISIAWLVINFLFLAWIARCKIPFRAYIDIGTIIGMVILQVYLMK